MLLDEEDDDVITSAPLLADIIGKKHTGGVVSGGTGLAQAPPLPAAARAAATNVGTPPPLPARAQTATPAGVRPPPLPPAVATPTPAPPLAAPASTKAPSQPPAAAPPAAPTSAKTPTPAPPAPAAPVPSTKVPTQPPPPLVPPLSAKVPTPPPPEDDDEGTEAPRKLNAVKAPTPAPEPPVPPVPSQRAKLPTDAPEQTPPSDVVPTAPRPAMRRSPTIPPAPKLPTGALGKPVAPSAPRPPVAAEDATDDDPRKKLSDTLPSGITMAALMQAEADAAAAVKAKAAIPPPPAGTKPLFEITKRPVPPPRSFTPPPRPAVTPPKPAVVPSKPPPPPSAGAPAASSRTKSSLPPPPALDTANPPADPMRISNVELRGVEPFARLPEEVQRALVRTAIIEDLVPGEARTAFGAVLVVAGEATVCAVNLDVPVKVAPPRSFIATRGSLATPVPMRIVGSSSGATISRWSVEAFDQALEPHPQAAQDCRSVSDALQARVGLTLGALAEVDLVTREAMLERLEVRALEPEEIITEEDGPMPGLVFVVGGSVEILEGDPAVVVADVRPGDLLFPEALWAGAAAPLRARAAATGALLLVGERKLALDFAENVPIVGELLSR